MRSALLEYLRNHVSSRGDTQEVYLRSTADDYCGVSYRISYQRHATQAATIAVRSSWPMDLELDFLSDDPQSNSLRAVCEEGPPHVTLTPTLSSSAILSWTLRPDDEETEDALRVIGWLSRLRCAAASVARCVPPNLAAWRLRATQCTWRTPRLAFRVPFAAVPQRAPAHCSHQRAWHAAFQCSRWASGVTSRTFWQASPRRRGSTLCTPTFPSSASPPRTA